MDDGERSLAMPDWMPTDNDLKNFEQDALSAQAVYWARSRLWSFHEWRDKDFNALSKEETDELKKAIDREMDVSSNDHAIIKEAYTKFFMRYVTS